MSVFKILISTIRFSQNFSKYNMNMPLKVKIICISIYYLMYKHLYNMALNLDVAFLLSVSIKGVLRRQRSGNDTSCTTPDPGYHMGKLTKNTVYIPTKAKRSALSQQVTTRQQ